AHEKIVEGELAVGMEDDDFAVEYEFTVGQSFESGDQFGEVAAQWLPGLRLQEYFVAGAESQAAETVPLRFKLPTFVAGERLGAARFFGRERRADGEIDFRERFGEFLGG